LRDELVDAREAPLVSQTLEQVHAQTRAVKITLEVEDVHFEARPRSERRADSMIGHTRPEGSKCSWRHFAIDGDRVHTMRRLRLFDFTQVCRRRPDAASSPATSDDSTAHGVGPPEQPFRLAKLARFERAPYAGARDRSACIALQARRCRDETKRTPERLEQREVSLARAPKSEVFAH
jgi:hypothetical protein